MPDILEGHNLIQICSKRNSSVSQIPVCIAVLGSDE